jgi:hypothetical protein
MGDHRKSARLPCDARGLPLTFPTFDLLVLGASDIFDEENLVMAGSAARSHASRRGVTPSRAESGSMDEEAQDGFPSRNL